MAVSVLGTPATFTSLTPANYTPETGSDRLVRMRFTLESDSGLAPSAVAATLGGVSFTQVQRDTYTGGGKTMTQWRGYILEANIPSGSQAVVVTLTGGTGNQGYAGELATLDGCAQTGLTNVSAAGTVTGTPILIPPSGTLTYADGDLADITIGHDRTPPTATATGWTFTNITGSGGDAGMSEADRIMSGSGTLSASVALSGGGSNAVGTMWIVPAAAAGPVVTDQPDNATAVVTPSTPATFTAVATTSGTSLSQQWYQGPSGTTTTPINAGGIYATNASGTTTRTVTLTVTPTDTSEDGETYWVRITDADGSVDSNAATLTVNAGDVLVQPVGTTNGSGVPSVSSGSLTSDAVGLTRLVATVGGVALDQVVVITKR